VRSIEYTTRKLRVVNTVDIHYTLRMLASTDCIFCKIVSGEIPATILYEDTDSVAFLDTSPVNKGHTLVIPRHHYENLFDLPEATGAAVMRTVQTMAGAVKKAVAADGINLGMNNGEAAGQIVFHAHLHIIPRFVDDGLKHWGQRSYELDEMEVIAEAIRSALLH
jgi:histidine triad (HIT) family protein